jgi:plastocyanin
MTFDTNGGNFADNTCKQGSPDKYLIAKNPRQDVTGMISTQVSSRNNADGGLTFPRSPMFFRAAPAATPKTFPIAVTNVGASYYVFNGNDRLTNHVDAADPAINVNLGDTIVFSFSISGSHPFHVKTTQTTGTSNNVTSGTITNNGQQTLDLTWDTNGVTPGTYYYICRFHSGMSGAIVIS